MDEINLILTLILYIFWSKGLFCEGKFFNQKLLVKVVVGVTVPEGTVGPLSNRRGHSKGRKNRKKELNN